MGFPGGAPPNMPGGPRPGMIPGMPPVSMEPPQHIDDSEPPNKRARTEDNLIPEAEFLQRHSVSFNSFQSRRIIKMKFLILGSHHDSGASPTSNGKGNARMEVKRTTYFRILGTHRHDYRVEVQVTRRDRHATGETEAHLRGNVLQRQQQLCVL